MTVKMTVDHMYVCDRCGATVPDLWMSGWRTLFHPLRHLCPVCKEGVQPIGDDDGEC